MAAGCKLIRKPSPPEAQHKTVQEAIRQELAKVGVIMVRERQRVVANFEDTTRPEFKATPGVGPKQVQLTIGLSNGTKKLPDSDATIQDLWGWLNDGTKPHKIRAKNASGLLFFMWGGPGSYKPKTSPIGRFGGPGIVVNPQLTVAREVDHPGFPGRKFNDTINKRLSPQIGKAITRGLSVGMRKLKAGNKR